MPRVIHFEIAADDPERASKFYSKVFGWEVNKWDGPAPYWLVKTGENSPGIDGGIMSAQESFPRVVNTIDVDNLDAFVDKISSSGGNVVVPRMAVPGIGYMAYCSDTEGNVFGIMQNDENAK